MKEVILPPVPKTTEEHPRRFWNYSKGHGERLRTVQAEWLRDLGLEEQGQK